MKVAVYSESEADDAALRIFAEGILGTCIEPVLHAGVRARGWPSVRIALKPVLKQLHFYTEAEGFILVVDSNGTVPHSATHGKANARHPQCRLCQLRQIREEVFARAKPRPDRPPMKTAIGLAVPSMEAWFRCDQDNHVNEAAWLNGLASGQLPYSTAQLKTAFYGTDRPSLALEKRCMIEAARRLVQNLAHLEACFPNGFGVFANELRQWKEGV
jgi:hypothetical protein